MTSVVKSAAVLARVLFTSVAACAAPAIEPPVHVVDLRIGQQREIELADCTTAMVKLACLEEKRDKLRDALRDVSVTVAVTSMQCI